MATRPWPLRRVLLDRLWQHTRGAGVRVAVLDTGVDRAHPQLRDAVDAASGTDLVEPGGDGTRDRSGHGTKVAGLIAARPRPGSGFTGLAPEAVIIPVRSHDGLHPAAPAALARAVDHAVARGADVINISQQTPGPLPPNSALARAVARAQQAGAVVVAAAGNDGRDGRPRPAYPAALPGVLAVAASDRDNERAAFSQTGAFVSVAAPGVDVVSTVPGGGHCTDSGTSFAAPYAAAVAALLKARHPDWSPRRIVTRIQQTAERTLPGPDPSVGWGVVDPVRALADDAPAGETPVPDPPGPPVAPPEPAPLPSGESPQDRDGRLAAYALGGTAAALAVLTGVAGALRSRDRSTARPSPDPRSSHSPTPSRAPHPLPSPQEEGQPWR
ncbi:type VII secretion-associated serine protease mycosin [Streptomyces sp. NPDC097619]|uniref:type VII secretion-associated serine protease mycosin n=1 Tax=Streptomyces sp. NPDC097619 TaxID=3157228 RepID=UPI00331C4F73